MRIEAADTESDWAPEVGMVGCSLRVGGKELLGQRGGLDKYRATGSTFGIPLLHPWANRLDADVDSPRVRRDANGLAIHGVLGASPHWDVLGHDGSLITAQLDFAAHDDYLAVFPYPHALEVEARVDPGELTVTTRVLATGEVPVPIAFGWHPYLCLPDVPRDDWELTLPVTEHLVLDDRMIPTGEREPVEYPDPLRLGEATFDDGYAGVAEGTTFALAGGGRTIQVEMSHGYPFAQVFAPPGEDLVCFEPMTAPTNALVSGDGLRKVAPGEWFEAVFRIRVS